MSCFAALKYGHSFAVPFTCKCDFSVNLGDCNSNLTRHHTQKAHRILKQIFQNVFIYCISSDTLFSIGNPVKLEHFNIWWRHFGSIAQLITCFRSFFLTSDQWSKCTLLQYAIWNESPALKDTCPSISIYSIQAVAWLHSCVFRRCLHGCTYL